MLTVLDSIPFKLEPPKLLKRARLEEGSEEADEFLELVKAAKEIGRPKALVKESYITSRADQTLEIDEVTFTSKALVHNLAGAGRAFPFIATCGREIDDADLSEGDFLKEYWIDLIKEHLLATGRKYVMNYIETRFGIPHKASMSPGSADAEVWPIQQQVPLFTLMGDTQKSVGVTLTDSLLMTPNKSVSGICFPTDENYKSCQLCHREECPNRHAPFDQQLWDAMA